MSVKQVIIVRRGCDDRFRSLHDTFGAPPISARIMWDRRVGERRMRGQGAELDRRRSERRGPEPSSWSALDFLVAAGAPPAPPSEAAASEQPRDGDLLVLRETSSNGPCSVSTVPGPAHVLLPSYEEAVAYAEQVADRAGADVWYTEDHQVFTAVRRTRAQSAVS